MMHVKLVRAAQVRDPQLGVNAKREDIIEVSDGAGADLLARTFTDRGGNVQHIWERVDDSEESPIVDDTPAAPEVTETVPEQEILEPETSTRKKRLFKKRDSEPSD